MKVDDDTKQAFLRVASTDKTVWRLSLVLSGDWSSLFEQQSQLYEVAVDDDTQGSGRCVAEMIDIKFNDKEEAMLHPLDHHEP